METSYIIDNKYKLNGTAYIELLPGKFTGSHWNESSIFFQEYHWEFFVRTVERHYPSYNPYGFQSLSASIWEPIIKDLTAIAKKIESGSRVYDIRKDISFMSEVTESEFFSDEDRSLKTLKNTIDQLAKWLRKNLSSSQFVSILGL